MKKFAVFAIFAAFVCLSALTGCSSAASLLAAAEKGDPKAQYALAESYRSVDPALAFLWMKRAADQDYGKALIAVGKFYRDGIGVAGNPAEAFACWEKALFTSREPEAARLLLAVLLPEPPPGKAALAVRCYEALLQSPESSFEERTEYAARALADGEKLYTLLRSAGRFADLRAMQGRFTACFRVSEQYFDLSDPGVLAEMDRLSDEHFVLPALRGSMPVPPAIEKLRPEYRALLGVCDSLRFGEIAALLEKARVHKDFEEFMTSVPDLVTPIFFGKPELYRGISAGRSLYDFALFGSTIEPERSYDDFDFPFLTIRCRSTVQDGRGFFFFGRPGLLPLPADRYQEYGKAELYGLKIEFNRDPDFKARLETVNRVAGELLPVEHTYRIIFDSRPYVVKVTVPVYERIGGKLLIRMTGGAPPLRAELEELVPGSPEYRFWENNIAMHSVNGVFTWKNQNAERYYTCENAYERLKLKSYEKEPFLERVMREFRPGETLEVIDLRRKAILSRGVEEEKK